MSGKSAKRLRKLERREAEAARGGVSKQSNRSQQQQQQVVSQVFQQFSGPLPMPQLLQGYDDVVPGAAERIMRLAEDEATHRRLTDLAFIRYRTRSMVVAAILAILALGGGIYLAATGHSVTGLVLILTEIGALVTVFLISQFRG